MRRLEDPNAEVVVVAPTPKRQESAALREARRDVERAKKERDAKLARFTPKHPDVVDANNAVADAERRLKRAEAEEAIINPPPPEEKMALPAKVDAASLRAELAKVEREIASVRAARNSGASKSAAASKASSLAEELVNRETEFARLTRKVEEGRQRIDALESRVFAAEITASSEFAEAAALIVIDEAFLPVHAAGRGRKLLAIAGALVFGALGVLLALGLAIIDDRVYRKHDLDELGIAPVLVVIPKAKGAGRRG